MLNIDDQRRFKEDQIREFEDGEVIFTEGEDTREMYVVTSGEVVVCKQSRKGEVVLATLRKGDFVGEMSLLESLPRSATARALGKAKCLVIHPGGFLLKIRRDPTFAFEMLQALSRRIRTTNENLMLELNRVDSHSTESLRHVIHESEFSQNGNTHLPTFAATAGQSIGSQITSQLSSQINSGLNSIEKHSIEPLSMIKNPLKSVSSIVSGGTHDKKTGTDQQ